MSTLGVAGANISAAQLITTWIARLSDSLYRLSGMIPTVRRLGTSKSDAGPNDLWWQCEPTGASTTVLIGANDASWRALANILKNSAAAAEEGDEQTAYLKLLDDSFGTKGTPVNRQPQGNLSEIVEIRFPEADPIRLQFLAETKAAGNSGFGMLLNIELPITVRFGKRQMLLQDLLNLNAGTMVEFDRHTNDPVELVVNGRVLARGEAVLVRGNYGVRIVEIADRQDRLETSAQFTQTSDNRTAI